MSSAPITIPFGAETLTIRLEHLEQLVRDKLAFEYWSHAASYLPMDDYRFSLPRKLAIRSGVQNHWFKKDPKLMASVLERIASDGPLMAKDFESKLAKRTGWESKPTKQALEMLYMQGDLMITERRNFHKGIRSHRAGIADTH